MTAQTILPANTLSSGYDVDNSCMFDGTSNAMHRTPGSASNLTTWTWSAWVKRSDLTGTQMALFGAKEDSNNDTGIWFQTDNTLQFFNNVGGTVKQIRTNRVFRDTSAWYHIVAVWDSSNGTAGNRMRLYVNGVEETSFGTDANPGDGDESTINDDVIHNLGRVDTTYFYEGYMAEVVLIDGQALTPTSFGEFDSDSGIWKPIDVSGLTPGTNGFYLDFELAGGNDAANRLGKDVYSGNVNFFTEVNFGTLNQKTDTCTNNFCTWAVNADNQDVAFASGGLKVSHGTNLARRPVISTFGVSSGKWYWEWVGTSTTTGNHEVGIVNYASPTSQGRYFGQALTGDADFTTFIGDGSINVSGTNDATGVTYTTEVIGIAVDVDNQTIYFYKNNSLVKSGGTDYSGMNAGSGFVFMANADRSGTTAYVGTANFGQPVTANSSDASDENGHGRFEYAPPSGFLAICTKNISETNS